MLSSAAFNAFLKTLEEPPEYVIFILATTEKHKIIPTILSRCQIYDFNRITIQDMVEHLQMVANSEGIKAEPAALNIIARQADGAMRDALSIFDQVAASTLGNVTYQATIENLNILDSDYYSRLVEAFLAQDVPTALLIYQEIRQKGFDSQFFINGLAQYLRDLMVAQNPSTIKLLEATDEVRQSMAAVAAKCKPEFLYRAMSLCNDADLNFRTATNKQFLIELTLVKLCQLLSPSLNSGAGKGHDQLKPIAAFKSSSPSQTSAPQPPKAQQPQPTQNTTAQPAENIASSPTFHYGTSRTQETNGSTRPQAATPQRRPGLMSISINPGRTQQTAESAATKSAPAAPVRETAFTNDALQKAWNKYIDTHQSERILVNTMMDARPTLTSDTHFAIEVYDQIQVETVAEAHATLLRFLHDELQNDKVDFSVSIRQGEDSPATWTSRKVLEHMIDAHLEFRDFVKDFNMTLG